MAIVILNLKTYQECFQAGSLDLLSAVQSVSSEHQLVLCPSALNAALVASHRKGGTPLLFAQHADANGFGAHTGSVSLQALRELGFEGTLLNHSEKKIPHEAVEKTVAAARELGMKTVVCADSIDEAKKVAAFSPWAVAIEPPELIGSGVSISTAQPDVVVRGVEAIKSVDAKVKAFVGAGVSTRDDFQKSLRMGAEGVLLASAFSKSKKPKEWLEAFLA
ncbi:MAG: triose-phosphate isomerase [Candidatus Micrarchaeota archaeon]|nr:triose-phosphate isomerase [Candidatus Micrarchaeota archaeon]